MYVCVCKIALRNLFYHLLCNVVNLKDLEDYSLIIC